MNQPVDAWFWPVSLFRDQDTTTVSSKTLVFISLACLFDSWVKQLWPLLITITSHTKCGKSQALWLANSRQLSARKSPRFYRAFRITLTSLYYSLLTNCVRCRSSTFVQEISQSQIVVRGPQLFATSSSTSHLITIFHLVSHVIKLTRIDPRPELCNLEQKTKQQLDMLPPLPFNSLLNFK